VVNGRATSGTRSRLLVLQIVLIVGFGVLVGQLWRVQIVQGDQYKWLANANRFREIFEPAARGVIYDREGTVLARNRPRFQVAVVPEDLPSDDEERLRVLRKLLRLLETETVSAEDGTEVIEDGGVFDATQLSRYQSLSLDELEAMIVLIGPGGDFRPIIVSENVPREAALIIQEMAPELPGVVVTVQPRREYPTGGVTSHLMGYTGPIPVESLESYLDDGYLRTAYVGLSGLEASLEDELRGEVGTRGILVDVHGREAGQVGEPLEPQPGNNLVLTLEYQIQQLAEDALRRGLQTSQRTAGVVIVMDPQNGAIRAMVSLPTFDNNLFAQGISTEDLAALSQDWDRPLVNHAVSGIYPPGSTFKIVAAVAGLNEGVITRNTELGDSKEVDGANDGIIWLPNRYFPWDRSQDQPFYCWIHDLGYGHGRVNLVEALAESCDTYFYMLGGGYGTFEGIGLEALAEHALNMGFGKETGIEIPGEHAGLVPDGKWKRQIYGQNWVTGDTYNMTIGQGFMLSTPLQVLNATVAVANGGFLYRPQLVERVIDADGRVVKDFSPELIRELPVSFQDLEVVREGMYQAVNWEYGTATGAYIGHVTVGGKTGTAEYFVDRNEDGWPDRDPNGRLPTHAWFTAFAPYEEPELAVVVLVDGGGEGSKVAVPIATEILEAYFRAEVDQPEQESMQEGTDSTDATATETPDGRYLEEDGG